MVKPLVLRNYQERAIASAVDALNAGPCPWVLCPLPTGSGKNIVGIVAGARAARGGDVLWVCHQKELLQRTAREVDEVKSAGLIGPDQVFRFSTIQALLNRKLAPAEKLIVVDEAHHLHGGQEWISNLRRRRRPVLGLTGTPRRSYTSDGWHLAEYVTRDELTPRWLSPPVPVTCRTEFTPAHVGIRMLGSVEQMDFDAETYLALDTPERNRVVADFLSANLKRFAPMVVYVQRVEHAEHLAEVLHKRGVRAAYVHGEMRDGERADVFDDFGSGRLDALVNVNLVSEGVDLPNLRSVVMAVPTMSDIRFAQMLGRGCRRTKDKCWFYLVDFVDNLGRFQPLLQGKHFFNGVNGARKEFDPGSIDPLAYYRFSSELPEQPYLAALRKILLRGFVEGVDAGALKPHDVEGLLLRHARRHRLPLSSDGLRPREVPFVHEHIFYLLKQRHPLAGIRKEVFIEEGSRCDVLIHADPVNVIEFAACRVNTSKVEQLARYQRPLERKFGRVAATLVAVSLNGSSRTRTFKHDGRTVQFINWHDYIRDLVAEVS